MSFDFRKIVPTLALLAAVSACSEAPQPATSATTEVTAGNSPAVAAADRDDPAELMRRANAAFRENRIVNPAGDNATELFLAVRAQNPAQPGLAEALVEIMSLANFAFDSAIRNRDAVEAERLQGLIARIDADSAITHGAATRLATLKSDLQREQERADVTRIADNTASATSPSNATKPAPRIAATTNPPAAPAVVANNPVTKPATEAAASAPLATPVPVAATPVVAAALTAPQAISKVAPDYPPQARSRKLEGFVELEFRVTASGSTEDIRVVRSEPEGLFDRNAVRALMRWKFKPAERNGVPEAATTRTTMNFRQS